MPRLLLVDDDLRLRALLETYLQREGFQVALAANWRQMERVLRDSHVDLIVLDLMLPDRSGLEICRDLRAAGNQLPIVMLTAKGDDVDRILGLEIGADDYLPKPFNPRELIARIRAILRRTSRTSATGNSVMVGDVELDPAAREVRMGGTQIDLTSVEFALLETLLRDAGHVVTREQLTETVLGRKLGPFDRVIDVHISNLRKKLNRVHGEERIKAVRGSGYLFMVRSETK